MLIWLLLIFIQIVGESLPISSSGHLALMQLLFSKSFPEWLLHFIHIPMLFIVPIVFYPAWSIPIKYISFFEAQTFVQRQLWRIFLKIVGLGFIASLCTLIVFFIMKSVLMPLYVLQDPRILGIGFLCTMGMLFSLFFLRTRENQKFSIFKAILVGFAQGVAFIPGVSRFACTYAVLRWCKISPRRAFELSFLLAMPIYCVGVAQGVLHLFKEVILYDQLYVVYVGWGVISSFVSLQAFYYVAKIAVRDELWKFGIYMFLPIAMVVSLIFFEEHYNMRNNKNVELPIYVTVH